jgi:hypothetical protein
VCCVVCCTVTELSCRNHARGGVVHTASAKHDTAHLQYNGYKAAVRQGNSTEIHENSTEIHENSTEIHALDSPQRRFR